MYTRFTPLCFLFLYFYADSSPRTKRVTMRDLQLVIAQDPISRTSQLRHRLALFNYTTDTVSA